MSKASDVAATGFTFDLDSANVQKHDCSHEPFWHFLSRPFNRFPWHSVKCLLQVHKDIDSSSFHCSNFPCNCLIKIASFVDLPVQQPNY